MPPHHHRHAPWEELPSSVLAAVDDLKPLVHDAETARTLTRLAFDDGPYHRRATNGILCAALLRLLEKVCQKDGRAPTGYSGPYETISLDDLPPHLRSRSRRRGRAPAVPLPTRLLSEIASDASELETMIDALAEGPPHDVAANALLLHVLESLYEPGSGHSGSSQTNSP